MHRRMIQTSLIDMENMFDLLDTDQDIKDKDDSSDIIVKEGRIEFRNVHFSYVPE